MLTSKQRAALRAMANDMVPIIQIGKSGIGEELIETVDAALEARELIKLTVLDSAPLDARAACEELTERLGADGVAVIGRKVTLYRPSKKKKVIELA